MEFDPKEQSDLLRSHQKDPEGGEKNGNAVRNVSAAEGSPDGGLCAHSVLFATEGPPDGGLRAHSVLFASFVTNGLLFGVINSCSVMYPVLKQQLEQDGQTNVDTRVSLVGVGAIAMTFLMSPLSGVLTACLGLRRTAVLGGCVAAAGLLLSSFLTRHVDALWLSYGLIYGLGASLAYTPSLAILGHYYKKYLGIVNGFVTIGSCVFTVFMPTLMEYMIDNHGLDWMFRLLALLTLGVALCGFIFKPIPLIAIEKPSEKDNGFKAIRKAIVNVDLWKNKKYRLWALSMPVALFGYFVPYVHMKEYIQNMKFEGVNANLPIQCIAVTSGIGRISFGFLGDRPKLDCILLQQISFYVIGVLTICLAFVQSFELVVAISLGMGLFEGGFIALIGPIAVELCGSGLAAQAIGCMLGLAAVPVTVGPPVAGAIFGSLGSYTAPFILAGISPLVGATLMWTVRCQRGRERRRRDTTTETVQNGHVPLAKTVS